MSGLSKGTAREKVILTMTEEDIRQTDASIIAFVDSFILSGKSETTANKYARYLWSICEGFDRGIEQLATDKTDTLARFQDNVCGSKKSLDSYKSAFRAYCDFLDANKWEVDRSSRRELRTVPSSSGTTWYHELVVDDIQKWKPLLLGKDYSSTEGSWIFRGQGCSKWGLETSLGRDVYKNGVYSGHGRALKAYEKKSMWIFGREAYKEQEFRDFEGLNLLSLMQHYGCKTRLLDFSLSPFIALYVAIEQYEARKKQLETESGDVSPIALWAVDMNALYKGRGMKSWVDCAQLDFDRGNRILKFESCRPEKGVAVIFPTICNRRISAQDGLFVMPISLDDSFEENLCETLGLGHDYFRVQKLSEISEMKEGLYGGVVKFVIKPEMIDAIKVMLRDANVTARTVYPDLEGLAKYVKGLDVNS